MRRLSRLFWFTVIAGTLASVLFDCTLIQACGSRTVDICRRADGPCADAVHRVYLFTLAGVFIGPRLLFWLACRLAPRSMKPFILLAADACQ